MGFSSSFFSFLKIYLKPKIKTIDRTTVARSPSYSTPVTFKSYYNFPQQNNPNVKPKIAIISFSGTFLTSDLMHYWTTILNLTTIPTVNYVQFGGVHNAPNQTIKENDGSIENTLDIQIIGGTCPNALITVYFAPNDLSVFPSLFETVLANNDICSVSWGAPETDYGHTLVSSINTALSLYPTKIICVASGDSGANDGLNVPSADFPAASPYVVSCGGTSLTNPNLETAWSWNSHYQWGGGGGVSAFSQQPAYQSQIPSYVYNTRQYVSLQNTINLNRKSPDIAFNADPLSGWDIYFNGQITLVGGTSCSAPFMAGFLGLCNLHFPTNFNTILYGIYNNNNKVGFKDITSGTINNVNIPYYFDARANYDLATGLGSINGTLLFNLLKNHGQ